MAKKKSITIADVYPWMTKEEQEEAEYNLRRYLRVVMEIYKHLVERNGGKAPIWLKRLVWQRRKKEKLQKQRMRAVRKLEKSKAIFLKLLKALI